MPRQGTNPQRIGVKSLFGFAYQRKNQHKKDRPFTDGPLNCDALHMSLINLSTIPGTWKYARTHLDLLSPG